MFDSSQRAELTAMFAPVLKRIDALEAKLSQKPKAVVPAAPVAPPVADAQPPAPAPAAPVAPDAPPLVAHAKPKKKAKSAAANK